MGRFISVTINGKDVYMDKSKIAVISQDGEGGSMIWMDGMNDEFGVNENTEDILNQLATK